MIDAVVRDCVDAMRRVSDMRSIVDGVGGIVDDIRGIVERVDMRDIVNAEAAL